MGFRDARQRVIRSLLAGDYQFEIRDVAEGKNLLEIGVVTPTEVVALLQRCRGDQYRCVPHHADASVPVHVFLPVLTGERWYVKAYLVAGAPDEPSGPDIAVLISVHKSVYGDKDRRS
jgi:hypothetical protein